MLSKEPTIPNKIDAIEWITRYNALISIHSTEQVINKETRKSWCPKDNTAAKELFELWNDKYLPYETNHKCGSCQRRVFEKIISRVAQNK